MSFREHLATLIISIFRKVLLYVLGYDKLVVYVGDSDNKNLQFSIRRYYIMKTHDIIQVPVTTFYDMNELLPPEYYVEYMKQFEEYCKEAQK